MNTMAPEARGKKTTAKDSSSPLMRDEWVSYRAYENGKADHRHVTFSPIWVHDWDAHHVQECVVDAWSAITRQCHSWAQLYYSRRRSCYPECSLKTSLYLESFYDGYSRYQLWGHVPWTWEPWHSLCAPYYVRNLWPPAGTDAFDRVWRTRKSWSACDVRWQRDQIHGRPL